ncbi:hypothetical protein THARTR1_01374 [Trichoderma harzianum]|uniref:Uncharacterized protein n=1 Tax=Trichoderma harzianum TaxID=5544 RepID=A0A2K0UMW3_TRIHA|nr:hypothetical protein THARTR1_01374 [Trichoderma harzianum]
MLEKVARNTIQQNQNEVQKVAEKLIASCFYFETTSPAKRDRGVKKYQCSGRIRCRFYEDTPNLKGLGETLLKYYTATFAPHFLIQNDDEPNATVKLELPKSAIEAMAEGSLAELPQNIVIRASKEFNRKESKAVDFGSIKPIFMRSIASFFNPLPIKPTIVTFPVAIPVIMMLAIGNSIFTILMIMMLAIAIYVFAILITMMLAIAIYVFAVVPVGRISIFAVIAVCRISIIEITIRKLALNFGNLGFGLLRDPINFSLSFNIGFDIVLERMNKPLATPMEPVSLRI